MQPVKHVVFLQGMPSRFFRGIAAVLEQAGSRTTAISLCAGDALFQGGRHSVPYRGKRADWPAYIDRFFRENAVTDLVLLGEQRDYHKEAVAAAQRLDISVTVTDFGYLRPDWITLERDGMTGNSRFPKDAAEIARLAALCPEADLTPRFRDSSWRMSAGDLVYSFSNILLFWLYPHYRCSYRRAHPLLYFPFMGWRMLLAWRRQARANQQVENLLNAGHKYFLLPLQLEHDFQIVAYSPFDGQDDMLTMVVRSFAAHAPPAARLVIKSHPWDPGFSDWRKKIGRLAARHGVAERVDYIDGGNLQAMIPASEGMVTVNSTSGIQALQACRPVIVLGDAVYDVPGLSGQSGLDAFWQAPPAPEPGLVQDFIRAIAGTIQIRGVFFSEPGLGEAVRTAALRIRNGDVGRPLA